MQANGLVTAGAQGSPRSQWAPAIGLVPVLPVGLPTLVVAAIAPSYFRPMLNPAGAVLIATSIALAAGAYGLGFVGARKLLIRRLRLGALFMLLGSLATIPIFVIVGLAPAYFILIGSMQGQGAQPTVAPHAASLAIPAKDLPPSLTKVSSIVPPTQPPGGSVYDEHIAVPPDGVVDITFWVYGSPADAHDGYLAARASGNPFQSDLWRPYSIAGLGQEYEAVSLSSQPSGTSGSTAASGIEAYHITWRDGVVVCNVMTATRAGTLSSTDVQKLVVLAKSRITAAEYPHK